MKWRILFGVSLLLCFTGLYLVVLFIHQFVIPRQNNPEFIDTYCTVIGIYGESGSNICDKESADSRRFDCVVVRVLYKMSNYTGFGHLEEWRGYHRDLSKNTVTDHRVSNFKHRCICS